MQVLESELWLADTSGRVQPKPIFRGSVMVPDGKPLTAFATPQLSPDGGSVYFLAGFAATTHALCRFDLSNGQASFLTAAVDFRVLTTGPNRGRLIAAIRTRPEDPEQGGYSYRYYLLEPDGDKISRIADGSAILDLLVNRYNR